MDSTGTSGENEISTKHLCTRHCFHGANGGAQRPAGGDGEVAALLAALAVVEAGLGVAAGVAGVLAAAGVAVGAA